MKVYDAIEYLLSRCDGAVAKDGEGFNMFDRNKVDKYMSFNRNYKNEQVLKEIAEKYKNQLGVDSLETEFEKPEYDIVLEESNGQIIVKFDYNEDIISKVKSLDSRRYNPKTKNWIIPSDRLESLEKKLEGYNIRKEFKAEEIEVSNEKQLILNEENVYIYFPYNETILDAVRALPNRKWNGDEKRWEATINKPNIDKLIKLGEKFGFHIDPELYELQEEYANQLEISQAVDADIKIEGLSKDLELMPFQKAGVKYAVNKKRTIIADEVGLGKTVQAIATVQKTDTYPVLVVCPAFLKLNWRKEYRKWLEEDLDITIIDGRENDKIKKDSDVYIINYSIIHHNIDILKKLNLRGLIVDESHYIKNHKAKRTKAVQKLAKNMDFDVRLLLSATPIKNRPKELIAQLKVLDKLDSMGGFWRFVHRYCNAHKTAFGLDVDGASNLEELHERLRTECMIRREKKNVLEELPPVNRTSIPIEISNMSEYRDAERDIIDYIRRNSGTKKAYKAMKAEMIVRLNKLRGLSAKGKLDEVEKWINDFLETGEKLIVFAHHKSVTEELADRFDALKITGNTSDEQKDEAVEAFQNNPDEKLIVISLQAGSEGITLTEASNVAFVEFGWTPTDHEQAEGRAYGRLNDIHGLNSYYFTAEDTIDEYVLNMIEEKREVISKTTRGEAVESEQIKSSIIEDTLKHLAEKQ